VQPKRRTTDPALIRQALQLEYMDARMTGRLAPGWKPRGFKTARLRSPSTVLTRRRAERRSVPGRHERFDAFTGKGSFWPQLKVNSLDAVSLLECIVALQRQQLHWC
jgi:hypothetical protein